MAQPILIKPTLSTPFPDIQEIWIDPITGLKVPKQLDKNLAWRAELLEKANTDRGLQKDLLAACSQSILFWFNTFAFTFNAKVMNKKTGQEINNQYPHEPFITWPIQDKLLLRLERLVAEGGDIACDKSRQMGASWCFVGFLHAMWLFKPNSRILELSRIEDYVDQPGNDKSLFWKHDYINSWLPDWMQPLDCLPGKRNRVSMRITNINNNSAIFGEATTKNAARGSTRSIVLLDEFSAVENGAAMRKATDDVAACRIINGTAKAGSEYSRWITSGEIEVFKLPWWEHPLKGLGRTVEFDKLLNKYYITSTWRKHEEERRSPKDLAEEVDMNHQGAGSTFFDNSALENYKLLYCKPPTDHRVVEFVSGVANDQVASIIRSGSHTKVNVHEARTQNDKLNNWRMWCSLPEGRPDQNDEYVFGIDISKGQGASNSVISAYSKTKGRKVGEWANSRVPPHEFARITVASALWFGGRNPRRMPFVIWEANGDPGIEFGRMMVKVLRYPYYYRDQAAGVAGVARKKKKYGFHSSAEKKAELLGAYSQMLAQYEIINPCAEAIDEAMTYIVFDSGQVGPSGMTSEKSGTRLSHGDRVIGDALATMGIKGKRIRQENKKAAPYNSPAWRREQHERKKKVGPSQFNWRHKVGI